MKVTVVGGGNIGTQFAVHAAESGYEVTIYTSNPEIYDGHLEIVDENGEITHEGRIECVTSDPVEAFEDAELIMVTYPSDLMDSISGVIYKYSRDDAIIGVVPGNGGSECALKNA